jgi:hypothetical protein
MESEMGYWARVSVKYLLFAAAMLVLPRLDRRVMDRWTGSSDGNVRLWKGYRSYHINGIVGVYLLTWVMFKSHVLGFWVSGLRATTLFMDRDFRLAVMSRLPPDARARQHVAEAFLTRASPMTISAVAVMSLQSYHLTSWVLSVFPDA